MPNELRDWNPLALRLITQLFDAATPFEAELEGVPLTVSFSRGRAAKPPSPMPLGIDPASASTWPAPLEVHAQWEGGGASLLAQIALAGRRYEGLVCLQVVTRGRGNLLWLNLPTCLASADEGVAHLLALSALLKRGDNAQETDALQAMVRRAGLPFGSSKKVSLAKIKMPEGEFITTPQHAAQNLAVLCLLKLRFYSEDERDVQGMHFTRVAEQGREREQALEAVQATTHYGLMVPTLRALNEGAATPAEIEASISAHYGEHLTPGDARRKPNGLVLWRYNVRWALTYLKQRGEAENAVRGQWAITEAGRERLRQELSQFDIQTYQTLSAKVLAERALASGGPVPVASTPPQKLRVAWHDHLASLVGEELFAQLSARLRPELGPSPAQGLARNIILFGPPGTGKTWLAEQVAYALTGEKPSTDGLVRLVQFHPSYGYEDFVWSIRPVLTGDKAGFREHAGPFLTLCKDALDEPDELFVMIIDEINRGDPARIFGELLYALEYRGREITLAGGTSLKVPTNLVILGTMNSVDRSVAMVDYALRRRFAFLRIDPDPKLVSQAHGTKISFAAAEALAQLNQAICEQGDPDLQIGHSYFIGPGRTLESESDLATIWAVDVAPQLAELFHGRSSVLVELASLWKGAVRSSLAAPEEQELDDPAEPDAAESLS